MSATDTINNAPAAASPRQVGVLKTVIAIASGALFGFLATFGFVTLHAPLPRALPAQTYTNVSPLATAACPSGDQVYYLPSINSATPAMRVDNGKLVDGKYRVTTSATYDTNGLAPQFTITVDGKVPIDALFVYNNTDAVPTTTAMRDVVRYVVPTNTGTLALAPTKQVSFSASTHAFACVPEDATGR